MKLENRERIEGTEITIGKRVYYRHRQRHVSRRYAAEYRDDSGKQVCENLKTKSRLEARRLALSIHSRIQDGKPRLVDSKLTVEQLTPKYFDTARAKGLAPKSEAKYRTDLTKLKTFCKEQRITLAHRFGRDAFYRYRAWLVDEGYADKTIYGALTVAKQVFKWGHQEGKLSEYRLAAAKVAKAKARPQPCFTTEQVELIIHHTTGVEQAAFATLAYAGLRIGEVEQLRWTDVKMDHGELRMFHICRGGSNGTTKDKDSRFVPIHPRVCPLLQVMPRSRPRVFPEIAERQLLARLKEVCGQIGFDQPQQYKLHSFRHHFASLCANHQVAYRKALAWLGHSSSQILDLYYHLHDADSQAAMKSLAQDGWACPEKNTDSLVVAENPDHEVEGNLRAIGGPTIEKISQDPPEEELAKALNMLTERVGFEPAVQGVPRTTV